MSKLRHTMISQKYSTPTCAVSINGTSKDAKLHFGSTKSGLWWSLTAATAVLASVSLKERWDIRRGEMIDMSDGREAVIWPIKASLQPRDTACGTCRISLTYMCWCVTSVFTVMYRYVHTQLYVVGELVSWGLTGFLRGPSYRGHCRLITH